MAPAGTVSVPAGDDSSVFASTLPADTTYWFAAGTHTLGTGQFTQIDASNSDTFIGAPGAVLDGQDENDFAFEGSGTDVTIEYLTIENFVAPQFQGVVNQGLSSGWVVENSTVENNPYVLGVGVGLDLAAVVGLVRCGVPARLVAHVERLRAVAPAPRVVVHPPELAIGGVDVVSSRCL